MTPSVTGSTACAASTVTVDATVAVVDVDSTPFSVPGRLSEHEPLVHAIDNWVLDHVLGVNKKVRTFEGFSLQDLDVLPENVVA